MGQQIYAGDELVESWDDATRTYTNHRTGESRPYTAAENAQVDAEAAEALRAANAAALREGLAQVITDALARQAEVQTIRDTPNADIRNNPASYVQTLAKVTKRQERAIIRLARLVGGLVDSTDTGTD